MKQNLTMKQVRQQIYIRTSHDKPEQIELVFVQMLALGGYKTEGVKVFPFDAHAVTDFIEAHGNNKADLISMNTGINDDFKNTLTIKVAVENCHYSLFND